jgi:hypothetical protein
MVLFLSSAKCYKISGRLHAHTSSINALSISSDRQLLASGGKCTLPLYNE